MPELTREHGISEAIYFHSKSSHAAAEVPELKRLRKLETENVKLECMYADVALENTAIKDVLSRTLGRRRLGARRCG